MPPTCFAAAALSSTLSRRSLPAIVAYYKAGIGSVSKIYNCEARFSVTYRQCALVIAKGVREKGAASTFARSRIERVGGRYTRATRRWLRKRVRGQKYANRDTREYKKAHGPFPRKPCSGYVATSHVDALPSLLLFSR